MADGHKKIACKMSISLIMEIMKHRNTDKKIYMTIPKQKHYAIYVDLSFLSNNINKLSVIILFV